MNSKFISVCVLAVAVSARSLIAQTASPAAPAPQVTSPAAPSAEPNQIIYSQRLPSANELMTSASAQGLAVDRIDQTSSRVTITYKYANGQTMTVAYQVLPTANSTASAVALPSTPAPTVVMPSTPYAAAPATTAVVYPSDQRVVYYDAGYPSYYPYYPSYWYPPVSLSLGFGFHGGGGFRGGFRGGGFHHFR